MDRSWDFDVVAVLVVVVALAVRELEEGPYGSNLRRPRVVVSARDVYVLEVATLVVLIDIEMDDDDDDDDCVVV